MTAAASPTPDQTCSGAIVAVLTMAAICAWFVTSQVVIPHRVVRLEHLAAVLGGEAEAPYRFRLLLPVVGDAIERVVGLLIESPGRRHIAAYALLHMTVFTGVFWAFRSLLARWFSPLAALTGCLMLALAVPLTVTPSYPDGDFITLLVYVVGLLLITSRRDAWLPLLVLVGTLNREQTAFLVVLHALHLFANDELRTRRALLLLTASTAAWLAVYFGLRMGDDSVSRFTPAYHLGRNTDVWRLQTTLPLWGAEVLGFTIFAAMAYRRSSRFFRLALLSLIPYAGLFAAHGLLWELAKFLPAHVVLIPMGLQTLTGTTIEPARLSR